MQTKTPDQLWAEKTILAYIDAKGLDIPFCSARYNIFLRGILLGDVPELTKAPSPFVKNDAEVQHIMEYAAQNYHLQQESLLPNIKLIIPTLTQTKNATPTSILTETLNLTALPPCDIVNAEGKLYVLGTGVFFSLGPSDNEIDRALKNTFPAWAAFQQRILGYSELASVGEIIEAASLGQEKFSLNPAVTLITLGLKLDWQLPPDGDLYSQSLIVGEQLHHNWFQWNNPDNEQLRLRYPNLADDGATYALYEFFDHDIEKLQNWCNTYQALFAGSPLQP